MNEAAEHLATAGRYWAQTCYHAGFAVELMLKAVRMRRDRLEVWPPHETGGRWHDIGFVAERCRLLADVERQRGLDRGFGESWTIVSAWDPRRRYPPAVVPERAARAMLHAAADRAQGVVPWLEAIYATI